MYQKNEIVIISNKVKLTNSLALYLKYVLNLKTRIINSLSDAYATREIFEILKGSDLLLMDGFINGESKGFQLAKSMEIKTLLFFYTGEIEIEQEGPYWLVFPHEIIKLEGKVKNLTKLPAATINYYENLESRFPALKEHPVHHS